MGPRVHDACCAFGGKAPLVDSGEQEGTKLSLRACSRFIIEDDAGFVRVSGSHRQVEVGEGYMVIAAKHEVMIRRVVMDDAWLKDNPNDVGILNLRQNPKKVLDHFPKVFFLC